MLHNIKTLSKDFLSVAQLYDNTIAFPQELKERLEQLVQYFIISDQNIKNESKIIFIFLLFLYKHFLHYRVKEYKNKSLLDFKDQISFYMVKENELGQNENKLINSLISKQTSIHNLKGAAEIRNLIDQKKKRQHINYLKKIFPHLRNC